MNGRRSLPKVDRLANDESLSEFPVRVRTIAAREALARLRISMPDASTASDFDPAAIAAENAKSWVQPRIRPAINLSGVILHTGLGRAVLAQAASEAGKDAGAHPSLLEFDEDSGGRGDRQSDVRRLLCELTGAEGALVVNNAAAAVFLSLAATSFGRDVLLSRGQMVEIGGEFRLPEIVVHSGCRLVEVGCTNKTRISDFEAAFTDATASVLRCHPSNYRIVGFAEEPEARQLAAWAHRKGITFIDDQGSGCIVDMQKFGLRSTPTVQDSLRSGADLVVASCDKLLGGPQAGMILGRSDLVEAIRRHPLARAVRIDKMTLAALAATLRLYLFSREAEIPLFAALERPMNQIREMAEAIVRSAQGARLTDSTTEIGAGCAPGEGVATVCAVVPHHNPQELAAKLRKSEPAVIGRILDGALWFDPRTAEIGEIRTAAKHLREAMA